MDVGDASAGGERAQSEVIGVVLLLAITVIGSATVVLYGSSAVSETESVMTTEAATQSMTQLDSQAGLVAHGGSDSRRVTLAGAENARTTVDPDAGWMNVTVRYRTNGTVKNTLLNVSLGAVTYRDGDTAIAYQGGGVWRRTDTGSVMISPPEFHYTGTTLTLPLVLVNGNGPVGERIQLARAGDSQPVYPNATAGQSNPLEGGEVHVTVSSDYYAAWGRFFETRTGGSVTVDDGAETATIVLVAEAGTNTITSGIVGTGGAKRLDIDGKHGDVLVDTYNSSTGSYVDTNTSTGTIVTAGGVELKHGVLQGNLVSGSGTVKLKKDGEIAGNLSYGGSPPVSEGGGTVEEKVGGWIAANGSAARVQPVTSLVNDRIGALESPNNDNGNTSTIENEKLQGCGDGCELGPGDYYLERVDLKQGETLVLDNTDGPISIAVEKDFTIDKGTVEVVDEDGSVVRFYVGHKKIELKGANVTVPNESSSRLWIYGTEEADIKFEDGSRFVGVVYAPTGRNDGKQMEIRDNSAVYGAVIGAGGKLREGAEIHFDTSLRAVDPIPTGQSLPSVTYLHVSTTQVNVTAG